MTQTQLETVPAVWDDELDGAFFALVHHLFPPAFLSGATALLTSYDEEEAGPGPAAPAGVPLHVPA